MKKIISLLFIANSALFCAAQSVGIGTNTPNSSAVLDVSSTTKGMVLPRMTTSQRKAIQSPAVGLLVFDLDKSTIYMYDGVQWLPFLFSAQENSYNLKSLVPGDVEANDQFGYSVSVSGDYVIIGTNQDDIGTNAGQGSAYIFMKSGANWVMQSKLVASDGATGDFFGSSVGMSGDYVVVGAPRDDIGSNADQGSIYVFFRNGNTWTQQVKLTTSDGAAGDLFGTSVSIDGLQIIAGSPEDDINSSNQGSAYFFLRTGGPSNWVSMAKVIPSHTGENYRFGFSVSISGTSAIIGAPYESGGGIILPAYEQGFAYIFRRSGALWSEQARISCQGADGTDHCGFSVAISGNLAIIGSPHYDGTTNIMGSASIFEWNGTIWIHKKHLVAYDTKMGDNFGFSVAIYGDYVLIGAKECDIEGIQDRGAAYLYKRSGTDWVLTKKLKDENGDEDSEMGFCVAINGFNCFIGSMNHNQRTGKMLFLNYE